MSSIPVARLALATMLLCPIAVVLATPAVAEPPASPCVSAGDIVDPLALMLPPQDGPAMIDPVTLPLQEPDTPTTSCDSELDDCMSASVQEGIYGERYVPPDAVAMCYEAYRSCTGEQSEEGGVG